MSIGIESGNENVRRNILNRKMSNSQIKEAITIAMNEVYINVPKFL